MCSVLFYTTVVVVFFLYLHYLITIDPIYLKFNYRKRRLCAQKTGAYFISKTVRNNPQSALFATFQRSVSLTDMCMCTKLSTISKTPLIWASVWLMSLEIPCDGFEVNSRNDMQKIFALNIYIILTAGSSLNIFCKTFFFYICVHLTLEIDISN